MRVAVFGAGGYIGRYLMARLRLAGEDAISYSSATGNVFDARTGILAESVEIPAGTECVIYLAQSPFYRQMPEMASHLWGVNVVSALKTADLARRCGAKRFIYASTGNVYSPSFSPLLEGSPLRRDDWYALSKVHAEEGLALYRNDLSVTAARIFGAYGPRQTGRMVPRMVEAIRSGVTIKLAPNPHDVGDQGGLRVSLCYIDDVVEIIFRLIRETAPNAINVAGPEPFSVRKIALAIGAQLGITPQFEVASQHREFDLIADVTKLVETLNPKFSHFSDGIANTVEKLN